MRIARVIGHVIVTQRMPDLVPGRLLVVRIAGRKTLAGLDEGTAETLVMYDELGARIGDQVALAESREATAPFQPKKVPVDAYCAAILEQINFKPIAPLE